MKTIVFTVEEIYLSTFTMEVPNDEYASSIDSLERGNMEEISGFEYPHTVHRTHIHTDYNSVEIIKEI